MQVAATVAKNLTTAIRNRQIRFGVVAFGVALATAVLLRSLGVTSAIRYAVFLPILVGLHGIATGLTGVCGLSAAWGVRQTEDGTEPIVDRHEVSCVRRRGSFVFGSTVLTALGVTLSLVHG
ncbi:MAG: hypothetical protein IPG50_07565 [Myxococcales bacterium]|nr:hypothetical protein [Myxococcales bacterium]